MWEHIGATEAAVVNERLGLRVGISSSLPRMWQWVDPAPGYYVLAIEPANCSVLGRAHDRAEGRLPDARAGRGAHDDARRHCTVDMMTNHRWR